MAEGQGPQEPWKLTPEVVTKLETAFSYDATVLEACYFADISRETFYRWCKDNPELYDRFERLRNKPILRARKAVVESLDDPIHAEWYLSRKMKKEFAQRQEFTGPEGGAIEIDEKEKKDTLDLLAKNKENLVPEQEAINDPQNRTETIDGDGCQPTEAPPNSGE